ncbi:hypothetical protein I4U23_001636 [Adineta vaga]|nr:hypothetical protein I4U23_001636 [Adineta vaga]
MLARSSPDMIDMGDFDEELVQSLIGLYYFEITASCLVYLLGFIGNLFALIIFASLADFRKISTGVLFLLMTISNFFHLWTLATESIAAYGYHLYPHVFFQCRLNPFVKNVSRAMSTYFSVGITIDRLIRSEFPMRSRLICTRRNVCKLAILFLILFCFFWSFYLFSLSTQDPITRNCNYNQSESYFLFLSKINIPLRAVFFCLIPIILMVLANARMLYNIRQSHQRIADVQTINTAIYTSSSLGNGISSFYSSQSISTDDPVTISSSTATTISSSMMSLSSTLTSIFPATSISSFNIDQILTYYFPINSSVVLKLGNITDLTALTSVESMVNTCFNLPNFNITVTRVEIISPLKSTNSEYRMITDIRFQTYRTDCNVACIQANVSSPVPTKPLLLPDTNGNLTIVTVTSAPSIFIDAQSTTPGYINYEKGDSPPGTPAKIGMGLCIPIITILLTIEIIYFYRKYGCNRSPNQSNYEFSSYTRPPAV